MNKGNAMLSLKNTSRLLAVALCVGLGLPASAAVLVNVCHGEARILSQAQTGTSIDMEVEVSVGDCVGECIGSLEYDLLFVDADNTETLWHMTENWNWRTLDGPFTLQLHDQALPNTTLKEVKAMKIGRCSCSTVLTE